MKERRQNICSSESFSYGQNTEDTIWSLEKENMLALVVLQLLAEKCSIEPL